MSVCSQQTPNSRVRAHRIFYRPNTPHKPINSFLLKTTAPPRKSASNFYHDVESLIWVYVWFLFNHVPTSLRVANKGFQKAAKSLQASASRWVAFANDAARIDMIKGDCHEQWRELREFWALTGTSPAPFLEEVRPVVIRQSFASAQRELQKQELDEPTRRWPRRSFEDTPYTAFLSYIAKHFDSLASFSVTSLSEIIKPESRYPEEGIAGA